MGISIDCSRSG